MTRFAWALVAALALALVYELVAAFSHHWMTISQMVWTLEARHPVYAVFLAIGFLVLFLHFFVRKWA